MSAPTHSACVKFAPIFSTERMANGWCRAERTMYQRGALKFFPAEKRVPLIVDHDLGKQVGWVHDLVEWEDVDGPWLVGRADVTDAPEWLKRGTKASFAFITLQRQLIDDWDRILRGIVTEVSILSPSRRPREPLAEVALLERSSPPAVRQDTHPWPVGQVINHEHGLIRPGGRVLGVELGNGHGYLEFER